VSENNVNVDAIYAKLSELYPIENDLKFNELDVSEKVQLNTYKLMFFTEKYEKAESKLKYLMEDLDKTTGERYHIYKFQWNESLTKPEIEKYYLPKDENILEIKRKIRNQEAVVAYFKMCRDMFKSQTWNLKTFLDSMRAGF